MRLLVKNIGTIVGIETAGRLRLCGGEMDRLETFDDAWLLSDDGRIAAFGSMDSLGEMAADEVVDRQGVVLHAHLHAARNGQFVGVNLRLHAQLASGFHDAGRLFHGKEPFVAEDIDEIGQFPGRYSSEVRHAHRGTWRARPAEPSRGCGG